MIRLENDVEFSRPFAALNMRGKESTITLEATPGECAALAARFGILDVGRLNARLTVRAVRAGRAYRVRGELTADVVQSCVVTLAPVAQHIEETLDCLFASEGDVEGGEILVDAEAEDVEPLAGGKIDLGELVAQQLALGLDPFPRAEGATLETPTGGGEAADGPFAALAKLRHKSAQ
jgi:uncharacterized metal-binding protein YceD (DUF177 family)